MLKKHYTFEKLRSEKRYRTEIKRPMCWLALAFVFVLSVLFWGKSYQETEELPLSGEVLIEGRVVDKEYKESYYGGYWQLVLKKVKVAVDVRGKMLQEMPENVKEEKVMYLDGMYLCGLKGSEEKVPCIGQKVRMSGTYSIWEEATNPGQFDSRKWYCSQGILGQFRKCSILVMRKESATVAERMWQIRDRIAKQLRKELGEKEGALVCAMLLGEKSGLEEESKNLYRRNGISHILAISGLHLMVLGMGLFHCLKQLFGNCKGVAVACTCLMMFYCVFVGNSISAVRATLMFSLSFGAKMLGRSYDSLSALGLSAIVQLIFNPYVLNNSGFLMSFLAVLGVTFVAPRIQKLMRAKRKMMQSFCVSLSASLTTLPVILSNYGVYPWYGIFLNLCILPVMSVLLFFSVLLVCLCGMSGNGSALDINTYVILCKAAKNTVVFIIKIILKYIEVCCVFFEKLPLQDGYVGSPSIMQIVIYGGLLWLVISSLCSHSYFCKKVILLSAVTILTLPMNFTTEITMLDVGQGDSVVIRNDKGNIYLSDCGSSSVSQVGKYRLLPFLKYKGYHRIKGIFISHLDEDHVSGMLELLTLAQEERIKISCLFLPKNIAVVEKEQKKLNEILVLAEKNRIETVFLERGDLIKDGNMQILCLHPGTELNSGNPTDRNNESLVFLLKMKQGKNEFEMLFTGDVEMAGESEILTYIDRIGLRSGCDVLKVAHHGSSGSGSKEFLKFVNPKISLISCGKDNPYGHPHKETMEKLQLAGSKIAITKDTGAITLKIGKEKTVCEFWEQK